MFINCPYCNALVATDPASDAPPEYCPRCAAGLRTPKAELPSGEAAPTMVASMTEEMPLASEVVIASEEPLALEVIGVSSEGAAWTPVDDAAREAFTEQAPAIDADAVTEAMLGPAAIEIEIASTMPDDARHAPPERDVAPEEGSVASLDSGTPLSLELPADAATESAAEPAPAVAVARADARASKPAPSFVRAPGGRPARTGKRGWRASAAIAGLVVLLALQSLLADRADLAANARWRPWITTLCGMLRCTVPPWREAQAFTLIERDVRPHPTVPGALRVTASFRNDARWPQPWPRLALTLSDVDGREAGARSFTATEYLGAEPTQRELESGQTATIAMDVIEPAPRIVAFTFEFH